MKESKETELDGSRSKPSPVPQFILRGHKADVQALCYTDQDKLLYTGDAIRDLGSVPIYITHLRSIHLPEAGITSLHWVRKCSCLVSQGRDGLLKVWGVLEDFSLERMPRQTLQTFSFNFCRCAIAENILWPKPSLQADSDKGARLSQAVIAISGSHAPDIELWSLEDGRLLRTRCQPEGTMNCGMCMALCFLDIVQNTSESLLAAGYEDGTVAVWDVLLGSAPLTKAKLHGEPVLALAAHGNDIFTGSAEDMICKLRFRVREGDLAVLKQTKLKSSGIADIAVRADGRIFATAGWDKKIRVFSTKTCAALAVLQYHRGSIASLAFNTANGLLVSAGRDDTVAFWSLYKD